jgi:hypothetical protein
VRRPWLSLPPLLLLPLVALADGPSTLPAASKARYQSEEHRLDWPLLDEKTWKLTKDPQQGVLAIVSHTEELGLVHPSVTLSFDRLPKEVTTARKYAETNISLLPKYGFTDIKQAETTFGDLPAVEVDAVAEGGKKIINQLYIVRGDVGYVLTALCPKSMGPRFMPLLKKARAALVFQQ